MTADEQMAAAMDLAHALARRMDGRSADCVAVLLDAFGVTLGYADVHEDNLRREMARGYPTALAAFRAGKRLRQGVRGPDCRAL